MRKQRKNYRIIDIFILQSKGFTFLEIANRLNISIATVCNYLNKSSEYKARKDRKIQEILKLYKLGMSVNFISIKLGISCSLIYYYLNQSTEYLELKKKIDKKIKNEISSTRDEICKLYESGMNQKNIVKEIGRSKSYIYLTLKRSGIIKEKKKLSNIQINRIATEGFDLYENGLSVKEIAKKFNISDVAIRKHMMKIDLERYENCKKRKKIDSRSHLFQDIDILRKFGYRFTAIRERINLPYSTVYFIGKNILNRHQIIENYKNCSNITYY